MRSEKRKNIIFFGLAFICLVLLFAWWPGKDPARIDMEGRKDTADLIRSETEVLAPDILLKTRSGEIVRLRTLYNEKPVCLYFWHPWTEYSKEGLNTLEAVKKRPVILFILALL